jgi:sarcosine oxidase, subunit gamma
MLNTSTPHSASGMPSLGVQWESSCALVNLRIHALDAPLREALVAQAHIKLPEQANTTMLLGSTRSIWAGPDDWFVMDEVSPSSQTMQLQQRLQAALGGTHHAITDVSSGYRCLTLRGPAAREVLAQGCPLDLHERVFKPSMSAGTHFFKASIWLWQLDDQPSFQLLVRRSFAPYVHLMLQKATREYGALADYIEEA